MEERKNIGVLFGGCSPEYKVSMESAYAVISHMDREKYHPVLIGISSGGEWFYYTGGAEKIAEDGWKNGEDCVPAVLCCSRENPGLLVPCGEGMKRIRMDAAFPVLHGRNGEDGTVQGLFELAGIPLAGCGVLSSALCMDKDRAHKLVRMEGIRVPASFVLHRGVKGEEALAQAGKLGFPLFVKPVRAGSSYGITRVTQEAHFPEALRLAFAYDDQVILEECIPGFEVGCAVLGNEKLIVGEPDEIELSGGFFDFTEKYTLRTSAIHVPARIPEEKKEELRQTARRIYRALDCRGFARVDMFLEPSGEIVFNEVNTIPGFTAHSRYPGMMKAAGMSFEQLVSAVIELALE